MQIGCRCGLTGAGRHPHDVAGSLPRATTLGAALGDNERVSERSRVWSGLARAVAFVRSAEPPVPVSRQAYTTDFLVAVAFSVVALASATPHRALGPLLAILTTAPLALRRYCPLATFWAAVLTIVVAYAGTYGASLVTFL